MKLKKMMTLQLLQSLQYKSKWRGFFGSQAKSDTELRSFLLITIGRLKQSRITRRLTVIYNIYAIHKIILTHFTNEQAMEYQHLGKYVTTLCDYFNCIAIDRPIFWTQYFTKVMTISGNIIYSGSTTLNLKNVLKLVLVEMF